MSDDNATGVALALTQSVTLWTVLLPPVTEVRRHQPGSAPAFAADVRHAEIVAASLGIAVGGVMSYMQRSAAPLLASVLIAAAMTAAYETTLQTGGHTAPLTYIHGEATSND